MFIGVLFIIGKKWKRSKCSVTNEWINKMYLYNRIYCSAIKSDVVLICITTQMNLESLMKSESGLTQKAMYSLISFIKSIQNRNIYENRK